MANSNSKLGTTPSAIEVLLTSAASNGFLKARIKVAGLTYKLAPAHGRNAGAVYVTDSLTRDYIGKIYNGNFSEAYGVTYDPKRFDEITIVMNNPQDAAISWGRETGECAICGRRLDNKQSVELGIGPICAEKIGFSGLVGLSATPLTDTELDDMI